jgi:hypothetical protein
MLKTFLIALSLCSLTSAHAEIKTYHLTENDGLNKKERIDNVENYLIDLSNSLHSMESKLDENAKKIKLLDEAMKNIRIAEAKNVELNSDAGKKLSSRLGESKADGAEMDKLKADILSLKNQDIEKLKVNLQELSDTVKAIQETLKENKKL